MSSCNKNKKLIRQVFCMYKKRKIFKYKRKASMSIGGINVKKIYY